MKSKDLQDDISQTPDQGENSPHELVGDVDLSIIPKSFHKRIQGMSRNTLGCGMGTEVE